ncbi:MAG: accessory factor UbiK family protein [Agarilytica sp.]
MIEQLASQIFSDIHQKLNQLNASSDAHTSADGASKIKALISARLRAMNLVTREEFDAQSAVLARTRSQLLTLQDTLAKLEHQIQNDQQ